MNLVEVELFQPAVPANNKCTIWNIKFGSVIRERSGIKPGLNGFFGRHVNHMRNNTNLITHIVVVIGGCMVHLEIIGHSGVAASVYVHFKHAMNQRGAASEYVLVTCSRFNYVYRVQRIFNDELFSFKQRIVSKDAIRTVSILTRCDNFRAVRRA